VNIKLLLPHFCTLLAIASPAIAQWTGNGVPLCNAPNRQGDPAITYDGSGGAIVFWMDVRGGANDIYAQHIDNMGKTLWPPNGIPVCVASGSQGLIQAISDGVGGAIIVWMDHRGASYDIYAQRITGGGNILWAPNGVSICTAPGDQKYPSLSSDGAGGAITVWEDERGGTASSEVFMQRVHHSGNVLWGVNGTPVCSNPSFKFLPFVATDGEGGALLTWTDGRADDAGDIYAQRVDGSGVNVWDAEGVEVCNASFIQSSRGIVSDGAGGAIAVWDDCRGDYFGDCTYSDIYAQRIDELGVPQWNPNGVAVTYSAPQESDANIVSDGEGGAIIAWDFDMTDVFAQRIDAAGSKLWTPSGIPVCTVTGSQYDNTMISDGTGGAIIAWREIVPSLNDDLYASRINHAGQALWGANGIAVTMASGEQRYPDLASDGWGGAIFAWQDSRSGVNVDDIYAQRITGAGSIPTSIDESNVPSFTLTECFPNPFSESTTLQLSLSRPSIITIQVYDVAGRLISMSTNHLGPRAQLEFDGTDGNGHRLPSGVYFARVTAEGLSITRKMILAR